MHALRHLPRQLLYGDGPQDNVRVHAPYASRDGELASPPLRERNMNLRVPRWGRTKHEQADDGKDDASDLPNGVHLNVLEPSPSKTLCSLCGTPAGPSPHMRQLPLSQTPVLDTAPFIRESVLFASSNEAVARAKLPSRPHSRSPQASGVKPLPILPASGAARQSLPGRRAGQASPHRTRRASPHPTNRASPQPPQRASPPLAKHALPQPTRTASPRAAKDASPRPAKHMSLHSTKCASPRPAKPVSPHRASCSTCDLPKPSRDEDAEEEELKRSAFLPTGSKVRSGWEAFTIESLVSVGGFGCVYRARTRKGESVAIKVMAKAWLAHREESLETAMIEYEILRRVSQERREFMTQLLCSWADEHNIYFVMRNYTVNLSGLIEMADKAMFPFSLYVAELVYAVSELHEMGYIHLDIKPENILVSPRGHLALADFGLAHKVTPENPVCKTSGGTVCYEAPEVVTENLFGMAGCDQRADVWSLGIVILQMFSHHVEAPHERRGDISAEMRLRTLTYDPKTLWEMRYVETHVPPLHHLLCQMLQRDPRLRIDMKGVKAHPYFFGVDWTHLAETESGINVTFTSESPRDFVSFISLDPAPSPARSRSKFQPIDYDFTYRCPSKLRALGNSRHQPA